jgi:acetamidase/formamidase
MNSWRIAWLLLMLVSPATAQGQAAAQAGGTLHQLPLTPANVHWGFYSGTLKPALTIRSGDRVRLETMVVRGPERLLLAGARPEEIPQSLKDVDAAVTDRGPGAHILTGPIAVSGAEPGDVVEIRFLEIGFMHPFGVSYFLPGSGTLPDDFPYARIKLIRFDAAQRNALFSSTVSVPLAPFWGSVGVGPSPLGRVTTLPPTDHFGGNFDIKDLVAGSTLYLPVQVPGALISLGDGHAVQGDGEVSLTALETSLRGTIQVILHKDMRLLRPRAETPTHYITIGLNPDLDVAAQVATREMVDLLVTEKGMSRDDAYLLCSLAADLHVSQLVDGTKGIHARLPKAIFAAGTGGGS